MKKLLSLDLKSIDAQFGQVSNFFSENFEMSLLLHCTMFSFLRKSLCDAVFILTVDYCGSTLIRGYQFSWIRKEETQVHGFLNSWFWGFQCTHQWKSPFCWQPNFVVWPTQEDHENWYPNSTFTIHGTGKSRVAGFEK